MVIMPSIPLCQRSMPVFVDPLAEGHPDAPLAVPDRTAAARELIALDQQHEYRRQVDALDEVDGRARCRHVADGAGNAAAVDRDHAAL